ncbi:hypothetical protein GPALN_004875 [Globodera pallida]|nr:hypothetical protein GPALN_004875 [Globodera pallida]
MLNIGEATLRRWKKQFVNSVDQHPFSENAGAVCKFHSITSSEHPMASSDDNLSGSVWNSLSPSLIFYLHFSLIGLVSAVAYHCYMIANFVQNGAGKADPYWMFWMALCYECANVAVPIAIFALTIDR